MKYPISDLKFNSNIDQFTFKEKKIKIVTNKNLHIETKECHINRVL